MKIFNILPLIIGISILFTKDLVAQIGYYDAPYIRYEADLGTLNNASATAKSYVQGDLQSEASDQVCVMMTSANASVEWPVTADGDGLVIRYSIPDGSSGSLDVYNNGTKVGTLTLGTYYSWQNLKANVDNDVNDQNIQNVSLRMRFDEVHMLLPSKVLAGNKLKLVWQSGTIALDFAELESVPAAVTAVSGDVTYSGDGSTLQSFIDSNPGKTIYVPAGTYNVNRELYFGNPNTTFKGAGMWYTEIHFTDTGTNGGLHGNQTNVNFSGFYLSTVRNSRTNSYKGINGVFTTGTTITDIWAEHFECGAWIAQFNPVGPSIADGFTLSNCRFRNNYADGINLSKGTSNSIVEHCSFRNNGDDDMAIWPANNQSCDNNTFRYNTAENSWRSSGCAIYGGSNNQAHHLLIKDNLEAGLKVNNSFDGSPFSTSGMHIFSDITIISCGTFNDIYNDPVGAIDISCTTTAGTRVSNVKFSNITVTNSRNDAVYIAKKSGASDGFYNLVFESITINGTGKEYPYNDAKARTTWGRGYGFLFVGNPAGYATYCNLTYSGRGGNAASNINNAQIGALTWTSGGCGTYLTSPVNGTSYGECGPPITLTGTADIANGAVDSIEFFIDGVKVGADKTAPYTYDWSSFTLGNHTMYVKSTHEPSATKILSPVSTIVVDYFKGLFATTTTPAIDGVADALWTNYEAASIDKISVGTFTGSADLSAKYQMTYDQNNLYLFVDVTDDVLVNDGGNRFDNDELEVFIDIGNTKSSGYGANDYTYNFVYNDATVYETQHSSAGSTTGVTFAQAIKTGGYTMEISIPWTSIGTMPGKGDFIGFDIHVDDDDDGGARDAKKAWNDCTDMAWQNPSLFGTLQDSSCAVSTPTGFTDFHGVLTNGKAVLTWSTYYDQNDYDFLVTRATGSGAFSTIVTVGASGTQGILSTLSRTDNATPTTAGVISYRISKVDKAGCIIMSDIVQLTVVTGIIEDNNVETEYNFYPNPFLTAGNLNLTSGTGSEGDFTINITDLSGKLVWSKNLPKNSTNSIGDQLSPGMYLLEIVDGATKKTIKLIKL